MLTLRFDGETDAAFRERAQRTARIARVLVDACLANHQVQALIADPSSGYCEVAMRRNPIVRVEYEQAIAIGGIGETLDATKSKHWGDGPWIMPLEPEDEFFPERITFLYRENALYNRRFEQRKRLKDLLGKAHRKLVGEAKYHAKAIFLRDLTDAQTRAIRRILHIEPGTFWRACQGREFLDLPPREVQREFIFE